MRCIGVHEHSHQHRHRRQRAASPPAQECAMLNDTDLQKMRNFAASSRSYVGFSGATYIKFDYKSGAVTAGKAATNIAGRKLAADMGDVMCGFQRLESGQKPQYALTRILASDVDPIQRAELSDADPRRWADSEKDPWMPVSGLPLFDPKTRQNFIFLALFSARDAVAELIQAFVDHATADPEHADQVPLVTFAVREYTKSDGNPGYALYFEIEGWIDRPSAVLHINPPPLSISNSKAADDFGTVADEFTRAEDPSTKAPASDKAKAKAKPARKIATAGGKSLSDDMADEIPF
jgi:hypothetical protein